MNKETVKIIETNIVNQARNLCFIHRIGVGNGEERVGVALVQKLLVEMGVLTAEMVREEMEKCKKQTKQIQHVDSSKSLEGSQS